MHDLIRAELLQRFRRLNHTGYQPDQHQNYTAHGHPPWLVIFSRTGAKLAKAELDILGVLGGLARK
jgi:hypothetical protein